MAGKIDIKELFGSLQLQMVAQLSTNREFIDHAGSKGDSLELTWIEWLRKYLPNRYCVDKAIIIDNEGNLSDQIDLVIYDQQFTPFVLSQNGIHYIPAEGVYAIFEVKPDLQGTVDNLHFIEYAGAKIESVRKLTRTSTFIIDRGRKMPPRPLTKIIGGILSSTNSMKKKDTLEKHLRNAVALAGIDMGCAVDFGGFIIDYVGEEDDTIINPNKRIHDYYLKRTINKFAYSAPQNSMISFFFQLTRYLQQSIGTVAAIDLNAYSKQAGFNLDLEI